MGQRRNVRRQRQLAEGLQLQFLRSEEQPRIHGRGPSLEPRRGEKQSVQDLRGDYALQVSHFLQGKASPSPFTAALLHSLSTLPHLTVLALARCRLNLSTEFQVRQVLARAHPLLCDLLQASELATQAGLAWGRRTDPD